MDEGFGKHTVVFFFRRSGRIEQKVPDRRPTRPTAYCVCGGYIIASVNTRTAFPAEQTFARISSEPCNGKNVFGLKALNAL